MRKKNIIILCVSFVFAFFLETIAWMIAPSTPRITSIPENAEILNLDVNSYIDGYDYANSSYMPNNNDPQIGFHLLEQEIQTIYIEFYKPLAQDIPIQIYFAKADEPLSEDRHIEFTAEEGERIIAASIPHDTYSQIRLDINGAFSLSGIYTSAGEAMLGFTRHPPEIYRFLLSWLVLFSVIWFCCLPPSSQTHSGQRLDMKKAEHKNKLSFAIFFLMTIAVILQINNSNMMCYYSYLPQNISMTKQLTFGTPRHIRSDEFIVSTPAFFHNNINGKLVENALILDSKSFFIWINNIITILNPYFWGELFLPASNAFSWRFILNTAFFIYIYYNLFEIITKSKKMAISAAFLIYFAPAIQWWSMSVNSAVVCGFIVFFYRFFQTEKKYKKIIYAWGLVCCASSIIQLVYPAWDIPYIYLFFAILIGIYATEKRINIKKTDIPYIAVTCVLISVVIAAYFISNGDASKAMTETVYPGKRFITGGSLLSNYWSHYLTAPFLPWKTEDLPLNQSEISHYIHLFPIPILIFVLKYKDIKKNKVLIGLVCFNIFCDIYMILGFGNFLAKCTFMSYSTCERLHIVWGLSSFMLLLLECHYSIPKNVNDFGISDWIKCFALNGGVLAFLIWTAVNQKPILTYIGNENFVYVCASVLLLGNLLYFGKKKLFMLLLVVVTIFSGVFVNPINFGTDVMTKTPLAKEIQEIDQNDSGKWLGLDDLITPKYIYAQGVDCLNYLSWPPRFDLFDPLDKNGEYHDIYNRYAHVVVNLTEEDTTFQLIQMDALRVFLNVNDLEIWNVKYIVSHGELPHRMESVEFEPMYYDTLDNFIIYKVNYGSD